MYQIVNNSTGVTVANFLSKVFALQWLNDNNFNEEGVCLSLYRLVRCQDASKTA